MRRSNFRTKLFRAFMIVGIPIFAAITLCSYFFLQKSANEQICEEQSLELAAVSEKLASVFDDTMRMSEEMLYNAAVQELLVSSHAGQQYPSDVQASYYINNAVANRDYVDGVVVVGTEHTLYSTERIFTDLSSFSNLQKKWWFGQIRQGVSSGGWFPYADHLSAEGSLLQNGTGQAENVILFARPVYSMQDYQTYLGMLLVYLKRAYLQDIWDGCNWGKTTNILLLDDRGGLVASNAPGVDYADLLTGSDLPASGSRIIKTQTGHYVYAARSFGNDGWHIMMIAPYSEVDQTTDRLRLQMLILVAAFAFVMFLLSRFGAANIAKPVTEMSEVMDAAYRRDPRADQKADRQGNLFVGEKTEQTRKYEDRPDEIGQIYRSFSGMVERQNALVQDIFIKDLERKDAELALLQTQINPHFLYNTLNSINWLALANDQEEISEMITALSDTFRLSLMKNKSSYTELARELQYVKSYLVLQKFRYGSRLDYTFDQPDPLPALYIPRFILQPVIENGIVHGIDSMEDGGRLDLSVRPAASEGRLFICVGNDNDRIDLQEMEARLRFDPETGEYLSFDAGAYGVQNINRRIKILCGAAYGLHYSTEEGRTYCTITLPLMYEDPAGMEQ